MLKGMWPRTKISFLKFSQDSPCELPLSTSSCIDSVVKGDLGEDIKQVGALWSRSG